MSALVLSGGHLRDGRQVDITVDHGIITAVTPHKGLNGIDLIGYLVTPSFVEPHAHLDKAFLADRVSNPDGDLLGAIRGLDEIRKTLTHKDTVARAVQAATLMSQNGVTHIRTHADTTIDAGLASVLALLEAKRICLKFIDIQVTMLLEWPVTGTDAKRKYSLAREAVSAGIDVVGGCPHLDSSPREAVEFFLEFALEHNLPLDLHADENLRADSSDLQHLAHIMNRDHIVHRVNASHCVSLSTLDQLEMDTISSSVALAGITVTALPQTNLYLQNRQSESRSLRGITPIHCLRKHGVVVAAGADNLQDPFNVMGRGDPLEIASLLVVAAHCDPQDALDMVTSQAAIVVLGCSTEIAVGQPANFVAIKATTMREAIAMGPPDRMVVYGGVVISDQIRNIK